MDRIEELEKPHLKLVVMHDFMWALVEEQAIEGPTSIRPGTKTLGGIFEWWSLKSMTPPRASSPMPFNQVDLQSVTMSRANP